MGHIQHLLFYYVLVYIYYTKCSYHVQLFFFYNKYLAQTKAKERFLSDPLSKSWETFNREVPPTQPSRLQLGPPRDRKIAAPQVRPLHLRILLSLQSSFLSSLKLSHWICPM